MTITIGKMSGKLKKYKYHVSDVPCLNLYAKFRVCRGNRIRSLVFSKLKSLEKYIKIL